jgi:conjugal transfer pilus assembly protein TraV
MTDMRRALCVPAFAIATVLGGCASTLSGLGGEASYACRAPVGSQCTSVSGVYANTVHGQPLASVQPKLAAGPVSTRPSMTTSSAPTAGPALTAAPSALRSPPRVLRLWVAPWEDADGDLNEASVVHVLVDTGRWLIERVRPVNRSSLDAVRPPVPSVAPVSAPASEPTPTGEPVTSGDAGLDRFPARAGRLLGDGTTREP